MCARYLFFIVSRDGKLGVELEGVTSLVGARESHTLGDVVSVPSSRSMFLGWHEGKEKEGREGSTEFG